MSELFRLPDAEPYQTAVDEWLSGEPAVLFAIARHWFGVIRQCGNDVRELMHDGCPVACVQDAAFAYVNVYKEHINIGFFMGAFLSDPMHLLQGGGKRMRHVKLLPGEETDDQALQQLIGIAYKDIKARL